jgi:hypothetical protein
LIRHRHAAQGGRTHREGRLVAQKQRQHAHGRASDGGIGRDVLRMIRRGSAKSMKGQVRWPDCHRSPERSGKSRHGFLNTRWPRLCEPWLNSRTRVRRI